MGDELMAERVPRVSSLLFHAGVHAGVLVPAVIWSSLLFPLCKHTSYPTSGYLDNLVLGSQDHLCAAERLAPFVGLEPIQPPP